MNWLLHLGKNMYFCYLIFLSWFFFFHVNLIIFFFQRSVSIIDLLSFPSSLIWSYRPILFCHNLFDQMLQFFKCFTVHSSTAGRKTASFYVKIPPYISYKNVQAEILICSPIKYLYQLSMLTHPWPGDRPQDRHVGSFWRRHR